MDKVDRALKSTTAQYCCWVFITVAAVWCVLFYFVLCWQKFLFIAFRIMAHNKNEAQRKGSLFNGFKCTLQRKRKRDFPARTKKDILFKYLSNHRAKKNTLNTLMNKKEGKNQNKHASLVINSDDTLHYYNILRRPYSLFFTKEIMTETSHNRMNAGVVAAAASSIVTLYYIFLLV